MAAEGRLGEVNGGVIRVAARGEDEGGTRKVGISVMISVVFLCVQRFFKLVFNEREGVWSESGDWEVEERDLRPSWIFVIVSSTKGSRPSLASSSSAKAWR